MKAIRIASAAFDHFCCIETRCYADQNALLGAPELLYAVPLQVALQLTIDHVGGQDQGNLAELGKGLLAGSYALLRTLWAGVLKAMFRRGVHNFDFVSLVHKAHGDGLCRAAARNARHLFPVCFDILQVDGPDDRDAGF